MREIRKINDKGDVIAVYSSISEAERRNGIAPQTLHHYIKLESKCHGYFYECDEIEPCYGEWDNKKKRRGGMYPCPFEETLRYFSSILPYGFRRKCKTYMRRVMLHNGRRPDEAFLHYYLKLPADVYVSSDEIVELVSQWRRQHTEQMEETRDE